jgi:hypothetical protein
MIHVMRRSPGSFALYLNWQPKRYHAKHVTSTGEAVGRLVEVQGLSPEAMEAACKGHNDRVVSEWQGAGDQAASSAI